jgi:hypothetical protein
VAAKPGFYRKDLMAKTDKPHPEQAEVQKWLGAVSAYERAFKKWEGRAEKIVKVYRDHDQAEGAKDATTTLNILWSNIQVIKPAVFARLPKPDVSRRFRDKDPVGRVAALLLERGLDFEIDHYTDYRSAMDMDVLDWLLGGRGTAWVRYEPKIESMGVGDDGVQVTEDVEAGEDGEEAKPLEEIRDERCPVDYVHWKDFGHTSARTWEEVTKVWRKVYMNRGALIERFGKELGEKIPLDTKPTEEAKVNGGQDVENQALVFEGWDKEKKEAVWFCKSMPQFLDRRPDPLELQDFWPCPRPLYATTTTDSLVPVPDYKLYQDQARELNTLADRIDGLIAMLKVRGVHDKAAPELARLFKEAGNGDLIGVSNFQAFAEKNGLKGSIDLFDLTPIVGALNEAYDAVEKVKNQIYEIMGIADIVRGSSDPNETLGAQKMKGQFGSMRLRGRQSAVIQYATEILQLKAQIICKRFQPQTLLRIAAADQLMPEDQQHVQAAMQLLMGERAVNPEADTTQGPLAGFRIEVSSDSMVAMDEAQEKEDALGFVEKVGGYLEKVVPVAQASPQLAVVAAGLLKFAVTRFKVGKTVEGMIDNALDQMTQAASQPQQPKPDPEMAKVQAQSQLADKQAQIDASLEQQRMQNEMAVETHRQEMQAREVQHQNQLEAQRAQMEQANAAQLEQMRMAFEAQQAKNDQALQVILQHLRNQGAVEVAEVSKETTLQAAQISAAKAGEGADA